MMGRKCKILVVIKAEKITSCLKYSWQTGWYFVLFFQLLRFASGLVWQWHILTVTDEKNQVTFCHLATQIVPWAERYSVSAWHGFSRDQQRYEAVGKWRWRCEIVGFHGGDCAHNCLLGSEAVSTYSFHLSAVYSLLIWSTSLRV